MFVDGSSFGFEAKSKKMDSSDKLIERSGFRLEINVDLPVCRGPNKRSSYGKPIRLIEPCIRFLHPLEIHTEFKTGL